MPSLERACLSPRDPELSSEETTRGKQHAPVKPRHARQKAEGCCRSFLAGQGHPRCGGAFLLALLASAARCCRRRVGRQLGVEIVHLFANESPGKNARDTKKHQRNAPVVVSRRPHLNLHHNSTAGAVKCRRRLGLERSFFFSGQKRFRNAAPEALIARRKKGGNGINLPLCSRPNRAGQPPPRSLPPSRHRTHGALHALPPKQPSHLHLHRPNPVASMASPRATADTAPVTAEAAARCRSTAARHSRTAAKESVWAAASRGEDCRRGSGVTEQKA